MASEDVLGKLLIHGEFLQKLGVANIYIGLKDGFETDKVRKVVFERKRIVVSVESADKGVREASIALPGRVSLVPRSMNHVTPSLRGCSFRFVFEGRSEPASTDPIFFPRCGTCDAPLVNQKDFSDGLLLSAFPRSSYFCHSHADEGKEKSAEVVPRAVSCFGDYLEFHERALEVRQCGEIVQCDRCHMELGFVDRSLLLLRKTRLAGHGLSVELKSLTDASRFYLVPKEVKGGCCVEVWVLDRKLVVLGAEAEVWKVLWQVKKEWPKGEEVLAEEALVLRVLETLESTRALMPIQWQRVGSYSVGFLS